MPESDPERRKRIADSHAKIVSDVAEVQRGSTQEHEAADIFSVTVPMSRLDAFIAAVKPLKLEVHAAGRREEEQCSPLNQRRWQQSHGCSTRQTHGRAVQTKRKRTMETGTDGVAVSPWWCECTSQADRIYTIDGQHEDSMLSGVLHGCRYMSRTHKVRGAYTCFELLPPHSRFACQDRETAKGLAKMLARNGFHGTLRKAGDEEAEEVF